MNTPNQAFDIAVKALPTWRLLDVKARSQQVYQLRSSISAELIPVFDFHYQQSEKVLDNRQLLDSPTGESNELYLQARGVTVIVVDSDKLAGSKAAIAMLVASLVAGNCVLICTDITDRDLEEDTLTELSPIFTLLSSQLPCGVVQILPILSYIELLDFQITNMVYIGNKDTAVELNRKLALTKGAIVPLLVETDLSNLPLTSDPWLAMQFVTEKVTSINIAAIGGNPALLETGSGTAR